jgi:hypothetical protein
MALPASTAEAPFAPIRGDKYGLPVNANTTIYGGEMLSFNSSNQCVEPLVAGKQFAGHAAFNCDNSGGANGAVQVEVYGPDPYRWATANSNIQNLCNTNTIPTQVFAYNANTLTVLGGSNTPVGFVVRMGVGLNSLESEIRFLPADPRVPQANIANTNTNANTEANLNTALGKLNTLITELVAAGIISKY